MASVSEEDAESGHRPSWAASGKTVVVEIVKEGVVVDRLHVRGYAVVGRDATVADVAMTHPTVSRRHAALAVDSSGALFAQDLGSTYGTTLDGVKLVPAGDSPTTWAPVGSGGLRFGLSSRVARAISTGASHKGRTGDDETAVTTNERPKEVNAEEDEEAQLPRAFGGLSKKKRDDRAEREREIAALTRELLETKPVVPRQNEHELEPDEAGPLPAGLTGEDDEDDEVSAQAAVHVVARRYGLPVSHRVEFGGGSPAASSRAVNMTSQRRAIWTIAADPGGARVITGSGSGQLTFYDFGGMDKRLAPFRDVEADDGAHASCAVSFSPSGDRFLSCTTSAQPQIFDRDGKSLLRFTRGDPYVTDPTRTDGHTTAVTSGCWQPFEKFKCATCSVDGSVRLWDLCGKTALRDWLLSEAAIRVRTESSRKAVPTALAFSPDGKCVTAASNDGSLQTWQVRGRSHNYVRPDSCVRSAHRATTDASGCVVSCVEYSPDGHTLASRADDGFVRVWDVRKFSSTSRATSLVVGGASRASKSQKPLVFEVPIFAERALATANVSFSPDGRFLCAGTDSGGVEFIDVKTKARVLSLGVVTRKDDRKKRRDQDDDDQDDDDKRAAPEYAGGVSTVLWHPRLRQILAGDTTGTATILYDPEISAPGKGALLSVGRDHEKARKKAHALDAVHLNSATAVTADNVINPNALPMFRDDKALASARKGKMTTGYAKARKDPKLTRLPDPPLEQGQQGRNTGARSTFCQYYVENNLPQSIRNQDPREALLKYADQPAIFRTDRTYYRDDKTGKPLMDAVTLEHADETYVEDQKRLLGAAGGGGRGPTTKRPRTSS